MSFDLHDPQLDADEAAPVPPEQMVMQAQAAAGFLKALSHEGRLMILCHLSNGGDR